MFPPSLLALWCGRAVQATPGKRRAVFEPFEMTQAKLREFARRRSRQHGAVHPKGHATATMVLATFAETKVARLPVRKTAHFQNFIITRASQDLLLHLQQERQNW